MNHSYPPNAFSLVFQNSSQRPSSLSIIHMINSLNFFKCISLWWWFLILREDNNLPKIKYSTSMWQSKDSNQDKLNRKWKSGWWKIKFLKKKRQAGSKPYSMTTMLYWLSVIVVANTCYVLSAVLFILHKLTHLPYFAMYNAHVFGQIYEGKIRMRIMRG